jgi:hypothetical protein
VAVPRTGKQNPVPYDLHAHFLDFDTVSYAGMTILIFLRFSVFPFGQQAVTSMPPVSLMKGGQLGWRDGRAASRVARYLR